MKKLPRKVIEGKVLNVAHRGGNGFFVMHLDIHPEQPALLNLATDLVTVVGVSDILPAQGHKIQLRGYWRTHPRYGRQFTAEEIIYQGDSGAIEALLGSGFLKHIKGAMAKRVAQALGGETFDVLDAAVDGNPRAMTVLRAIRGIGPKTGPAIVESWEKECGWAKGALACTRAGLTLIQARKAKTKFGALLENIVLKYPYRLTIVRGITWERADRIAKMEWPGKVAIPHDSPQRYAAAMREVLERAHHDGQMCLPAGLAVLKASELCLPNKPPWEMVEPTAREEGLILWGDSLYLADMFRLERAVAAIVAHLIDYGIGKPIPNAAELDTNLYSNLDLTPTQADAVRMALANPVSIITGGPGTGKTTITQVVVNALGAFDREVILCSPTGKAADRLSEATLHPAGTIHRTLGVYDTEGGRRRDTKFDAQFIIVDEVSMLDSALAYHLFDAVEKGAQILLVGDVDQLPSVGAGEVLYQLIAAGVPTTRLTQIHRQAEGSGIVQLAHQVNNGIVPWPTEYKGEYEDCFIGNVATNDMLASLVKGLLPQVITKYKIPFEDIQILTPVNGHDWGRKALNIYLQSTFNPGENPLPALPFRMHDKVIHLRNNYNLHVFNGQVGEIVWIASAGEEKAWLEENKALGREDKHGNTLKPALLGVKYRDKQVDYTRDDLEELALAYALTVHKSQGSEFPAVILLLPVSWRPFMLRQLLYTGLTRAKKYALVLAVPEALEAHITNEERVRRHTNLAMLIRRDME